ncbi:MAG: sigma-E processing peptidase SpoIIGA [Peptococcaceae bacterium]|nr:sigma-E processing peptidase SpoIIGA [Peptococcaceae bacterium]
MIYLDITLLLNGCMDAFILIYTAYLLRKKVKVFNVLVAVVLGEIPVVLIVFGFPGLAAISKVLVPVAMVRIGLSTRGLRNLGKGLLYFSLLSAVCGGIYFALSAWTGLSLGVRRLLTITGLWVFPLMAIFLVGGHRIWEKLQKANIILDNILYDVELFFEESQSVKLKALLDTGNELRDPLTGTPVLLLEEKAVLKFLPEKISQFLQMPWRESPNPWSYIWNNEEYCRQNMVFISARGINGQTWLPGIRIGKVKISQGKKEWELPVTVAFVPQTLSTESRFQALLHPEHIPKLTCKEEIA